MNTSDVAHLRVALCQSGHAQIMEEHAQMSRVMRRFWVAQAASLQVSAACRDREMESRQKLCAKDVAGRAAGNNRLAACAPQKHAGRVRYPIGVAESAAACSCNAGSLTRSRKYWTICSTNPASDRGKMKEYFGPFPAAGEISRFSNKNRGS